MSERKREKKKHSRLFDRFSKSKAMSKALQEVMVNAGRMYHDYM
jgi:hypothetical protein